MGTRAVDYDDLTLKESQNVRKGIKVSFDGEDGELDLVPVTYDALREMLLHRNPQGVQEVFAPDTVTPRRSKTEMDHIRTVARAATNPDGTPLFDFEIKDTGRLRKEVSDWFENEYQEPAAEVQAEAETPTRGRGRRS